MSFGRGGKKKIFVPLFQSYRKPTHTLEIQS